MMSKNERNFWIAAIVKAISFILITVFTILLTLEIQAYGFSGRNAIFYLIVLLCISLGYIAIETRINFLIKED